MAAMWRSCGSTGKTSGIAGSCSLLAQMSQADTRGQCALQHDQKFVIGAGAASTATATDARAAWSVTAGGENSARLGDQRRQPACLPAVRPSLRQLWRFMRTRWRPRSSARSRRKGCTRQSRSVSAGFAVDVSKATPAMRSSDRRGTRPAAPRSSRWRRCADRRRGKASLRRPHDAAARFFPVRRLRNLFLLSAHGHESNYACAQGREGNEAFIVGGYRGEYWR
jgi:hypothetical protein